MRSGGGMGKAKASEGVLRTAVLSVAAVAWAEGTIKNTTKDGWSRPAECTDDKRYAGDIALGVTWE